MFTTTRMIGLLAGALVVSMSVAVAGQTAPTTVAADARSLPEESARRALPTQPLNALPIAVIEVDASADQGPLELWRHSVGHGGVNSDPLPDRVVDGAARLHPRLIRIFIQEFFTVYPESGRFDWGRLDRYMDAFARTGAKVVAAITIKPRPLFPQIDPAVWQPKDVNEWQRVIAALVRRYSVEKPIVTHWEIGNETDIGENGGCPYFILDPKDYLEFYKMTIEPVLAAFPQAKVGGCAVANAGGEYLPRFIDLCRQQSVRLDFISWHHYGDDSVAHARLVERYRKLLEPFGPKRPEMMVTEWSKGFEPVSVEEMAFDPRRAALTAAAVLAMNEAGVDWSFYYHLWDRQCHVEEFAPFFRDPQIMYHHWNEVPHRFGLFGVNREVRPQYFVYRMLGMMGERRLRAQCDAPDLRVLASSGGDRGGSATSTAVLIVNCDRTASKDRILNVRLSGLKAGPRSLVVYRIDRGHAWSAEALELLPTEQRDVDVNERFTFQVFSPGDSVTLVELRPPATGGHTSR